MILVAVEWRGWRCVCLVADVRSEGGELHVVGIIHLWLGPVEEEIGSIGLWDLMLCVRLGPRLFLGKGSQACSS